MSSLGMGEKRTSIDFEEFKGIKTIKNLKIRDSIKDISMHAFEDCINLETLVLPEGLERIEDYAFLRCAALKKVEFPSTVKTIEDYAFSGTGLEEIVIPENVKYIGKYAFNKTPYFNNKDNWENGVLYAGKALLAAATAKVKDSYSVKEGTVIIAQNAFNKCSKIKEIYIPASVKFIGANSFARCENLEKIVVAPENQYFCSEDGVLYDKDKTKLLKCSEKKEDGVIIPSTVTQIYYYAFSGCGALESIVNESAIKVPAENFEGLCLGEGFLPNHDLSNEEPPVKPVLAACYLSSKERYSKAEQEMYDDYIKKQNVKLFTLFADNGNKKAMSNLLATGYLKAATIEKALEKYKGNTEMTAVLLDYQNKNINVAKEAAKKMNKALKELSQDGPSEKELKELWKGRILTFSASFFGYEVKGYELTGYNGNDNDVIIPSHIGKTPVVCMEYTFKDNKNIESVVIPEGILGIGNKTFKGCSNIKQIIVPESIVSIKKDAFDGTKCFQYEDDMLIVNNILVRYNEKANKKTVVIPEGVTKIEDRVFCGHKEIEEIVIPKSVTNIGWFPFTETKWFENQGDVVTVNNILVELKENSPITKLTVPDGIKTVLSYSCDNCKNLKEVIFPEGLTEIRQSAFNGCENLESINLPNTLKNMHEGAFHECSKLESIEIPKGIEMIEYDCFSGCTNLKKITLSEGIKIIGSGAFSKCMNLEEIAIPKSVTKIGYGAFSFCTKLKKAVIPEGVKKIESTTFYSCENLEEVVIPKSVTTIEEGAFDNCKSLKNIVLPEGVKTIKKEAFWGCDSLESITLPQSLKSIPTYSPFWYSNNLTVYAPAGSYAEKYVKEHNIKFEAL